MSEYRHILLATSLADRCFPVAIQALELAQYFAARLSLLHVLEPMQEQQRVDQKRCRVMQQCRQRLQHLGKELVVPQFDQHVLVGNRMEQIIQAVKRLQIDLIVIGKTDSVDRQQLADLCAKSDCDLMMVQT